MALLNFPSSPTNGQVYTSANGVSYQYNGTFWSAINTSYATGGFTKLDNISSGFNGSNTTFNLTASGVPVTPGTAQNLIITIGGVTQEPANAYTVSTSTITFTSAPPAGVTFSGVMLGAVMNVGVPSDSTVTSAKLDSNIAVSANLSYGGTLTGSTGVLNIGSGQIYKDASGNLGVGTGSPSYKLEVVGGDINVSADSHYRIGSGTDRYIKYRTGNSDILYSFSSGNFYRQDITNSTHSWFTGNTERLRLDATGNLGLGVTPSGWGSGFNAFQAGNVTSLYNDNNNNTIIARNAYRDSVGNKYIISSAAQRILFNNDGSFVFGQAPSGTAGAAISFTQAMTLDASGNLLVGRTSSYSDSRIASNGWIYLKQISASAYGYVAEAYSNDAWLRMGHNGTVAIIGSTYNSTAGFTPLTFYTSDTERVRIDTSGQFLLGTTSVVDGNGAQFVNAYTFPRTGAEFRASGTSQHYAITFRNGNGLIGNINTSGTTTSYVTSSDQRLKENIVDAPSALNSINNIKVRSFDWKTDGTHVDYGYVAQELLEVAPEAVSVPADPGEMMGVDFGKLTPRLVKAIQELADRLEILENK